MMKRSLAQGVVVNKRARVEPPLHQRAAWKQWMWDRMDKRGTLDERIKIQQNLIQRGVELNNMDTWSQTFTNTLREIQWWPVDEPQPLRPWPELEERWSGRAAEFWTEYWRICYREVRLNVLTIKKLCFWDAYYQRLVCELEPFLLDRSNDGNQVVHLAIPVDQKFCTQRPGLSRVSYVQWGNNSVYLLALDILHIAYASLAPHMPTELLHIMLKYVGIYNDRSAGDVMPLFTQHFAVTWKWCGNGVDGPT
jgi:hypothetical protein